MSFVINHPRQKRTARLTPRVDWISKLPEAIICHILSLLPAEDAVMTGSLSKNWKFLWRNIHILRFNDKSRQFSNLPIEARNELFADFVNKVLSNTGRYIEKFCLEVDQFSKVHDITRWIADAVSRNPKVIEFVETVSSDSEVTFELPCSLFSCKTLQVLHLWGRINLNLPDSISLPNLKTLTLDIVIYQDDECIPKLISGCSSLETLIVFRDECDNVFTFTIDSPTLRNLTYHFNGNEFFAEELEHMLELHINAPQLRYLEINDSVSSNFCIENLCLLKKAQIDISGGLLNENDCKPIVNLLQGLYNVKNLSWLGYTLQDINEASIPTSFPRLSRLTLKIDCLKPLLKFIESSKKLEYLTIIKNEFESSHAHGTCWRKPDKVPDCMLSSLKTVSIQGYGGEKDEVEMLTYIQENAKVLKRITI